jgi:hypothetical protein
LLDELLMNCCIRRYLVLTLAMALQGCAGAPPVPPKIERISAPELEARLPQPAAALPLEQIVVLARQGTSAEEIIRRITESRSRYRLTASRITELAGQGVPLKVLDHMLSAERTHIFDDMAAEAAQREKVCQDRVAREVQMCRSQMTAPMWFPSQPFIHCFPPRPGSPFGHCL